MKPSTVQPPRQGGKIRGTVSYAIHDDASRRAHRSNALDEAEPVAQFEIFTLRNPRGLKFTREQFEDFDRTRFENVEVFDRRGFVQPEAERFACQLKDELGAGALLDVASLRAMQLPSEPRHCPKSILSGRPLVTLHFPRDAEARFRVGF
jgi:hypothetical protein